MQIKSVMKPVLSLFLAVGCAAGTGIAGAAIANAQGLNFRWNSQDTSRFLPFSVELSNDRGNWSRYRLRLGAGDMKLAATQFAVTYPNYFDGKFDAKAVEVKTCRTLGSALSGPQGCKSVPVDEVTLDTERGRIAIYPKDPVPAGTNVELVLSNVRNPSNDGMYQLKALVESPGDVPLLRYLGMWNVSIGQ
jgi:hypothetical protein